jgi:hypothetical protein
MANGSLSDELPRYYRNLLLGPRKRNQVVELWEVEKFGRDCFSDHDAVSLYGMRPAEWHARGVRILARTTLEAVRDPLGNRIGQDVARIVAAASTGSPIGVIDPFTGSGNGLYWILRHLPGAKGVGFEFEPAIVDMTTRNLALLATPIRLFLGDFHMLLGTHTFPPNYRIVAFLDPPWADALNTETGRDLGRAEPPIGEVIEAFERVYAERPLLYVIKVHERLVPEPLAALRACFEWSEFIIYDVFGPTGRHGVLLGTRRWQT